MRAIVLPLGLLLLGLAACTNHRGGGALQESCTGDCVEECRDEGDCGDDRGCVGPNDGPFCGVPPREHCTSDTSCTAGNRCHAVADACSRDGVGAECGPPCTTDNQCGVGLRCDAGACVVRSCTEAGVACAARQLCEPSRIAPAAPVYDQHSGCFDVVCDSDADCGERYCVNGICQDGPGECYELIAVP